MFISIFISLHVIEKHKLHDIGINFSPKEIMLLLAGILTSCIFYIIVILILPLLDSNYSFSEFANILMSSAKRGFIGVLVVPLTEELLYRGYILRNTFDKLKFYQINLLSALFFSIGHWQYVPGMPLISFLLINMLSTFLIGLVFNNIAKITNSIWFGVGLHWFFNYLGLLLFKGSNNLPLSFILFTITFTIFGILITNRILKKTKLNS
ncbi:MAG: CPBP family intramembrane metalloprotease [Clostridium butyricum]|nr:CPBP family intramembrane metalloprotease [Clostridium butyricum]